MQYALAILAQGFCVLKIIITQFPDGFRLNTLEPFGAGSVQVDVFFLKIGVGLPSFAFRVRHILMTRKNKKDFFFSSRKTNLNSFYSP